MWATIIDLSYFLLMTCQYVARYCAVNNLSPKVTLSQIEKLLENNFMTTVDYYDSTTKTENLNS